jgi:hypothetical protein
MIRPVGFSVLLIVAGSALPAVTSGQASMGTGRPVTSDAVVRVYSATGSIRITAWPHDSVSVRGRVDSTAGRLVFAGSASALKLGIEPPGGRAPEGSADLDIQVPERARLWVKSSNAEIEIVAGGGSVEVAGGSGRVRIAGRAASVNVETLDGNVELALESASGRVRTASGTIVVRGVIRELDASSVSGPLLIGMEGAIARARLETVSSEIAFKGDLDPEGRLAAETHGGDVELRLPLRLAATFHLVSYGGAVVNELVSPSSLRPGPGKGEWTFQTGDGRATVDVRTFKGQLALKVRGER